MKEQCEGLSLATAVSEGWALSAVSWRFKAVCGPLSRDDGVRGVGTVGGELAFERISCVSIYLCVVWGIFSQLYTLLDCSIVCINM